MVKFLAKEIIQDVKEIDRKGDFLLSMELDKMDEMVRKYKFNEFEGQFVGKWLQDKSKLVGDRKAWKETVQQVKCRQ